MCRDTILGFLALGLAVCLPCRAATFRLYPDGSGDFPTIQAAIDAAVDRDVILLGYGRFAGTGNRDLDFQGKLITVRSETNHPQTCIIDCEGSAGNLHRGVIFAGEGRGSILQGVTIENGFVDDTSLPFPDLGGGAILIMNGASPTIVNVVMKDCAAVAGGAILIWSGSPRFVGCRFENNGSCGGGGGYGFLEGSPEFEDCAFVANTPLQSGGGIYFSGMTAVTLTNCTFTDNVCLHGGLGGGLGLRDTPAVVTGCMFIRNSTYGGDGDGTRCTEIPGMPPRNRDLEGGAISIEDSPVTISGCTMVGNWSYTGGAIGLSEWQNEGSAVTVSHCIIANSTQGGAIGCAMAADSVRVTCTDIYNNVGGDWTGCILGQNGVDGNVSSLPLFCDAATDNYSLRPESPCAPENSGGCGLIGARSVGCIPADGPEKPVFDTGAVRIVPNPTSGDCRIELGRPIRGLQTVQVVDVAGRVVRKLPPVSATPSGVGIGLIPWDGRDGAGRLVGSGVYFVRIETVRGVFQQPLVIAR
jgi:hypothetical protein